MEKRNFNLLLLLFLLIIFLAGTICSQNSDAKEKGTRTLYLIRHGEYNIQNESDSLKTLTPLGIAQARLLSARLKSMNIGFSSLISSTMTRARQTAEIINKDFPDLEMQQYDMIRECTPPTWREEIMAEADSVEMLNCVEDIEKAFLRFFIPSSDEKDRNDIIVCHGNVIRYFVTKVLNVNTLSWLQMSITNCSLTIIRILPDGRMKLDSFGDYGHIPENMRTYTGGNNLEKELQFPDAK